MIKANTTMTTRIDADNAIEIFSSVPTCFSSSGVYCAMGVLAAEADDFTGAVLAVAAIGARSGHYGASPCADGKGKHNSGTIGL